MEDNLNSQTRQFKGQAAAGHKTGDATANKANAGDNGDGKKAIGVLEKILAAFTGIKERIAATTMLISGMAERVDQIHEELFAQGGDIDKAIGAIRDRVEKPAAGDEPTEIEKIKSTRDFLLQLIREKKISSNFIDLTNSLSIVVINKEAEKNDTTPGGQ